MDGKLKTAAQNYKCGCTCSQAVFCAYAEEMGIDAQTAYRLMEGFGGGCGGMQEVCGALAAAFAIVSFYSSDGKLEGGSSRSRTYQKIQETAELFRKEYGGITCREVLHGNAPKAFQCGMKVKDTVLIIDQILKTPARAPFSKDMGGQKREENQGEKIFA